VAEACGQEVSGNSRTEDVNHGREEKRMKSATAKSLRAGVARRVITPEVGGELAGFDARKGVSTGIHDDLFASALVLSDGDRTIALVSLDLIGVTQSFTDLVRHALKESIGIKERDLILCGTHTHCAPATIQHFYDVDHRLDAGYMEGLLPKVVEAVEDAFRRQEEAVIRTGLVPVKGIAKNRRTESGEPVDEFAGVILVEDRRGRPRSIVVNYACHPTVLGPNTLEITRDFPNYLVERLERHLGKDVIAIYFNGTEGDLSIGHKSNLSAVGVIASYRTFAKAKEIGELLASFVIESLDTLQPELPTLDAQHEVVRLPLKTYPPLSEVEEAKKAACSALEKGEKLRDAGELKEAELVPLRQAWLFARIDDYYSSLYERGRPSEVLTVELSVVRLGNTAMVFLPGEIFVEIGIAIRKHSPLERTMIFGLANDYIGYVHTVNATKESGYEVVASRVTAQASLILASESALLLERSMAAEAN
jgi:neutral ceramidase